MRFTPTFPVLTNDDDPETTGSTLVELIGNAMSRTSEKTLPGSDVSMQNTGCIVEAFCDNMRFVSTVCLESRTNLNVLIDLHCSDERGIIVESKGLAAPELMSAPNSA
eukprot:1330856-Rhodomonas_salina.2